MLWRKIERGIPLTRVVPLDRDIRDTSKGADPPGLLELETRKMRRRSSFPRKKVSV